MSPLLLAALLLVQGPTVAPDTMAAPAGVRFRSALARDLDGDGRVDLVLAAAGPSKHERRLLIHRQRAGAPAFAAEPDATLALGADVTVFAVGDFHADPGREVVLCNAGGVFLWRPQVTAEGRLTRLCATEVLWQVPEGDDLVAWPQLVTDFDGDQLDDLVLPCPDGYTLLRQQRSPAGLLTLIAAGTPVVPEDRSADATRSPFAVRRGGRGKGMRIDLDLGGGPDHRGPLVQVDDSVPVPVLCDFDGDGRADLWALRARTLHVWLQDQGHHFASAPSASHPLPVASERRLDLDVSYSAHAADLDGDHKGDLVMLAGERGGERNGTQVLVFVQGRGTGEAAQTPQAPLFGPNGIPAQLLVLSGIAGAPRVSDLDGDGRPDLSVLSFRPDLMDLLKAAASEELTAEVLVFRGQGGTFARKPDLSRAFPFGAGGGAGGDRERMRCIADLDGDQAAELLIRSRSDELQLFHFRRRRDALTLDDDPWLRIATTSSAQLIEVPADGKAGAALLVLDPERLQILRAR